MKTAMMGIINEAILACESLEDGCLGPGSGGLAYHGGRWCPEVRVYHGVRGSVMQTERTIT